MDDPYGKLFVSVTELTARIKQTLKTQFEDVALHAEVSNVARPKSGHIYFTLKDDAASIRAVIWKSDARLLAFDLTDGLSVRVLGGLTVYEPRGEYQITVRKIEPEGIGALELAFRQRFAKLSAEGLFDPRRKRPLPRYPRRIVVVTSPTGAAVRDLLQVISRRWRSTEILIAPTRVQGEGADREVVAALELANRVAGAEIIVIARGRQPRGSLDLQRGDRGAGHRRLASARGVGGGPRDRRDARGPGGRPPSFDTQRGRRGLCSRLSRSRATPGPPRRSTPPGR